MLPCPGLWTPHTLEVLEKGDPVEDLHGSCRDVTQLPVMASVPPPDVSNPVDRRHG